MSTQIFLNGITIEQLADAIVLSLSKTTTSEEKPTENDILTREQACTFLSCNKTSLWKYTKSGKIKSYGIGNRVFYKRHELIEALKPLNK